MKIIKKVLCSWAFIALIFGLTSQAHGDESGAEPAPGVVSCLEKNPGSGALALRGTVAIEVISAFNNGFFNLGSKDVNLTLRLERSGVQHFFRLSLFTDIDGLSNEEVACRFLNPSDTNIGTIQAAVAGFVNLILNTFFGPSVTTDNSRLVITSGSISETDTGGTRITGSRNTSNLAEITIYKVSK